MNHDEDDPKEIADTSYEVVPGTEHTTACDHEWGYTESDPNSNLVSVRCSKCPQGASIDPDETEVFNGRLVPKEHRV